MKAEGYLRLFNGRITGYVTNPVTGRVIPRSHLVDIYRYLCSRVVIKGPTRLTYELLDVCRKMLEIPKDVHTEILREMRSSPQMELFNDARPYLLDELEAVREGRLKAGFQEPSDDDPEDDVGSDILELDKGSLVDQMETVEGVGTMGNGTSFSEDFSLGELEPDLGRESIRRWKDREVG